MGRLFANDASLTHARPMLDSPEDHGQHRQEDGEGQGGQDAGQEGSHNGDAVDKPAQRSTRSRAAHERATMPASQGSSHTRLQRACPSGFAFVVRMGIMKKGTESHHHIFVTH